MFLAFSASFVLMELISNVFFKIFEKQLENIGVGGLAFLSLIYPFVISGVIYSVVFSRELFLVRDRQGFSFQKGFKKELVIVTVIVILMFLVTLFYSSGILTGDSY